MSKISDQHLDHEQDILWIVNISIPLEISEKTKKLPIKWRWRSKIRWKTSVKVRWWAVIFSKSYLDGDLKKTTKWVLKWRGRVQNGPKTTSRGSNTSTIFLYFQKIFMRYQFSKKQQSRSLIGGEWLKINENDRWRSVEQQKYLHTFLKFILTRAQRVEVIILESADKKREKSSIN